MEIRDALDKISFESLAIENSNLNTTVKLEQQPRFEGVIGFRPQWQLGRMDVSLRLKAFANEDLIFDMSFLTSFSQIVFETFTETGTTELKPILKMVLAGLSFSTARGIIFQIFASLTGSSIILPIVRPELLIQDSGFEVSQSPPS